MSASARQDLVQVVNDGGKVTTRHLAPAKAVPESELVWATPVGHARAQYVTRVRPDDPTHTGAPVCGRCWQTLPGVVEARLIGTPGDVAVTVELLRLTSVVEVSRPQRARKSAPGHVRVYAYVQPLAGEQGAARATAELVALRELERAVRAMRAMPLAPTNPTTSRRLDAASRRVTAALARIDELAAPDQEHKAEGEAADG